VGDAEVELFARQGFLVIENALSPGQVSDAISAISDLLSGSVPTYQPQPWGRKLGTLILPPPGRGDRELSAEERLEWLLLARGMVEHDQRLGLVASHPDLQSFLRRAMADVPVLVHNMVRAKPPPMGREKPWHQDLTHFSVDPAATVVSAWFALDDAPIEAGCLHFVPGTHLLGPVGHVYDRDYQIPDSRVARHGQVAAPVRRGGCVLLNALVHHGSPPNLATGRRLALQLTFKPEQARMISDDERIETFSAAATPQP
jgi:phytanoyl-CoA hydroxylase